MPNGLPLEICMRFAAEALKECSTTCNTKYKLPDRCCDACHDEILAKLRLCTRQSDQYFAPQLYRTIRFTDITLTRRFKTLIKNCVSNPPWIEELVIVLEEEGGDPQAAANVLHLFNQLARRVLPSLKIVCLELGAAFLDPSEPLKRVVEQAAHWCLTNPDVFVLCLLDRNVPCGRLTLSHHKVTLAAINRTSFTNVEANLQYLTWIDSVASLVTDLTLHNVVLEILAANPTTLLTLKSLRIITVRDVRLALHSEPRTWTWEDLWTAGLTLWLNLAALSVENVSYTGVVEVPTGQDAKDAAALEALQLAATQRSKVHR